MSCCGRIGRPRDNAFHYSVWIMSAVLLILFIVFIVAQGRFCACSAQVGHRFEPERHGSNPARGTLSMATATRSAGNSGQIIRARCTYHGTILQAGNGIPDMGDGCRGGTAPARQVLLGLSVLCLLEPACRPMPRSTICGLGSRFPALLALRRARGLIFRTGIVPVTACSTRTLAMAARRGFDLTGAVFDGSLLDNASFYKAIVPQASFVGSLNGHRLSFANATNANFADANLTRAARRLRHALRANLNGATITGADLQGASITGQQLARDDELSKPLACGHYFRVGESIGRRPLWTGFHGRDPSASANFSIWQISPWPI